MPFVNFKTNKVLTDVEKADLKSSLGKFISILPGKSESWLMVEIEDSRELYFRGTNDLAAMVEVKIYGGASSNSLNSFTKAITDFVSSKLNIDSSRIYVSYFGTNDWGYDGSNF